MKTLKLELDAVRVESFSMEPARKQEPEMVEAYVTAGSRTCIIPFCS